MRRLLTAIALVAATASLASAAPPPSRRTVTVPYKSAGGFTTPVFDFRGGTNLNGSNYGAAVIPLGKDDRSVAISLKDDTGGAVAGSLAQDVDANGVNDFDLGEFCGTASDRKLPAVGGRLVVYILAGTCGAGPSAPTTGTVVADITRVLPKKR